MRETAYASAALGDEANVCCSCFASLEGSGRKVSGLRCQGGCGEMWCSEACRGEADRGHVGMECKALAGLDVSILNDGDAALARLFVKLLCRRAGEEGTEEEGRFEREVGGLESIVERIEGERLSELGMVAEAVLDALPRSAAVDEEELESLLCAEQCNSFGVWRRQAPRAGTLAGFGIFPVLCNLNHSCLPNVTVCQEQSPPRVLLRARTIASVEEGEELCISYSEASLLRSRAKRRRWLSKTYSFECACPLCLCGEGDQADAMADSFERQYRCPRGGCEGLLVPSAGGGGGEECAVCGVGRE